MPSLNFNQITKAYKGSQLLDKIYHGNKQIFPVPQDPVILWLKGDDFSDSSSKNQIITNNNVVIEPIIKKYGSGSFNFNANNRVLLLPNNAQVAQSDFVNGLTIEWWQYALSPFTYSFIGVFQFNNNGNYDGSNLAESSSGFLFETNAKINVFFTTDILCTITLNTWEHFAVTIQGTAINIFRNGINIFSGTRTPPTLNNNNFSIGNYAENSGRYFQAYMDSFAITKGIKYTNSFNPETDTGLAY
jgi:hypothetical protein